MSQYVLFGVATREPESAGSHKLQKYISTALGCAFVSVRRKCKCNVTEVAFTSVPGPEVGKGNAYSDAGVDCGHSCSCSPCFDNWDEKGEAAGDLKEPNENCSYLSR